MECSGMSCLMENYCLKVVTPSGAVLYLLKTFDFYIKKNARKCWCSWNKYFQIIFAAPGIITSTCVTDAFDTLKIASPFSQSSVRTTILSYFFFYFCFHNWRTLLNVLVFSLIIWTFCIKLSGAFKCLNWFW